VFHGRLGHYGDGHGLGNGTVLGKVGLGPLHVGRDGPGVEVEMAHPGHLPDAQALGHL